MQTRGRPVATPSAAAITSHDAEQEDRHSRRAPSRRRPYVSHHGTQAYIYFDPESRTQIINNGTLDAATSRLHPVLLDVHLPTSLNYHNVFLLALVASSGERLCSSVRCLQECGAIASMVYVVSLMVSAAAVQHVRSQQPDITIIAAHIIERGGGRRRRRQPGRRCSQPQQNTPSLDSAPRASLRGCLDLEQQQQFM
ncbi:putative uracil phosphoribosyltransferase [Phytophthora cinnamomi]|uniref:putative uracil phosphoribosyltransferase n=1 Tax=Phytophthora cinnamomi TaxID=4785 RepID=UPI00355A8054|nr:putative uracil phosphoribosyltransferase [Phytophthora cinnamomi]